MADEIVRTSSLRREYGDVVAVKDTTFPVPSGAVMAQAGLLGWLLRRKASAVLEGGA